MATKVMTVEDSSDREFVYDIRQGLFWNEYLNPKSETYSNAYRSALKVGYSEWYATTITGKKFFKQRMRRMNLLGKAEKVLDRALTIKSIDENGKAQPEILRIQTDVAKHITKTLGKDEGYSERSEITGKDGEEIRIAEIIFNPPVVNPRSNEESGN